MTNSEQKDNVQTTTGKMYVSKEKGSISRNIDMKIRKNLLQIYAWSVALYGSEKRNNSHRDSEEFQK